MRLFPDKPFNIVTDCDEILTDISPLWVQKIHDEENNYFKDFFRLVEGYDHTNETHRRAVLSRPVFHLNKWLLKKELQLTEAEAADIDARFMELYDNDEFYEECLPTNMCSGIYQMSQQKFVDKIFVVTRTTEGTMRGKKEFLETWMPSTKVEIVFVGPDEKKSDYIKQMGNVSMIAEDELKNIHDIVDNCKNLSEIDLFIPSTGYNQADDAFMKKLSENKFKPHYYEIFDMGVRR
jgi:hypothetical protein